MTEENNSTIQNNARTRKWKPIHTVIVIAVLIALLCGIGLPIILSDKLTIEEKMAIENVQILKGMLKDINSIVLNKDIEYLIIGSENKYTYYFIDFSAKNGYGGYDRKTAVFKNNEYIGDKNDTSNIEVLIDVTIAFAFLNRYEVRGLDDVCTAHGFINKDIVIHEIK